MHRKHCKTCDSEHIHADGRGLWDPHTDTWIFNDDGVDADLAYWCGECDTFCEIVEKEIEEKQQ